MPSTQALLLPNTLPDAESRTDWPLLPGSANALAVAETAKRHPQPIIVVVDTLRHLNQWHDDLQFFLTQSNVTLNVMPDWECLAYDLFSPHQDIVSERLSVLSRAHRLDHSITLIGLNTLMTRLSPVQYVRAGTLSLEVGADLSIDSFRNELIEAAYINVSEVRARGELAVRGGIVDLFPMGCKAPLRIELFGDTIDTIRYFDAETQRSGEQIQRVDFYPAKEFPLDGEAIGAFRSRYRERFAGDPKASVIYNDVSNKKAPAGIEYYLPLFFDQTSFFGDFFAEKTTWVLPHDIGTKMQAIWAEIRTRHQSATWREDRPPLNPEELFFTPEQLSARFDNVARIVLSHDKNNVWDFPAPTELSVDPRGESPYQEVVSYLNQSDERILICVSSEGRRELLSNTLAAHSIKLDQTNSFATFMSSDSAHAICVGPLANGVRLSSPAINVITEHQLYGETYTRETRTSDAAKDPEAIIRSLAELTIGDPIVHDDHGVGRYQGLRNIELNDQMSEFMVLTYQNDDTLYVPVMQLDRVSRYLGGDSESAPLHRLGSPQWSKAKEKAKARAHDLAAELLENEALRSSRSGLCYTIPPTEYADFVSHFAHEETEDQARAIADVLADMASDEPMDRLVCGDVGFGKTEVAMRAAFVAAWNAKQVAVLVPTTLLAQQHFETFSARFAHLPLKIGIASRFQNASAIEQLLTDTREGKVDIIIGTHRLIQKDIRFKRLGLVILDEEQRFGVRQKEVLKTLKKDADVLTLTATPIPRTLNLAMSGIRAISIIATPPRMRLAVNTFTAPWNDALVREAISRELNRGGQVYALHNEVKTIQNFADKILSIVPDARIEIAHGQMGERELSRVMTNFYQQRANVLVCTTIIENGIDNPNANTIIVNRADKMGLAQLHQIRGRVGRSHHQAYAYLFTPSDESLMTPSAHKRMAAIAALDELGAGFALASQDLEIRGSGELLGDNQSGAIDEVGFSQYTRYLRQAIASLNKGENAQEPAHEREIIIEIGSAALIPETYIGDVHTRLVMYKRLANAPTKTALDELEVEFADRFGALPEELKTLVDLTALKIKLRPLGVQSVRVGASSGTIEFYPQHSIDVERVIGLIQSNPRRYKFKGENAIELHQAMADQEARIAAITNVIEILTN